MLRGLAIRSNLWQYRYVDIKTFDGARLREARKARGLSQSQLGSLIGAHVTSISDWERGANAPSGRHIASISRELGVSVEELYGDDDEESSLPSRDQRDLLAALAEALAPFRRERQEAAA